MSSSIPSPRPLPRPPFLQRSLSYVAPRPRRPAAPLLHLRLHAPPPRPLLAYLAARAPDGGHVALAARSLVGGEARFALRAPRGWDVHVVLVEAGMTLGKVHIGKQGCWRAEGEVTVEAAGGEVRMGVELGCLACGELERALEGGVLGTICREMAEMALGTGEGVEEYGHTVEGKVEDEESGDEEKKYEEKEDEEKEYEERRDGESKAEKKIYSERLRAHAGGSSNESAAFATAASTHCVGEVPLTSGAGCEDDAGTETEASSDAGSGSRARPEAGTGPVATAVAVTAVENLAGSLGVCRSLGVCAHAVARAHSGVRKAQGHLVGSSVNSDASSGIAWNPVDTKASICISDPKLEEEDFGGKSRSACFSGKEIHVYSGFVSGSPEARFARIDYVCPLCVVDCASSATLLSHIRTNHAEVSSVDVILSVGQQDLGSGAVSTPRLARVYTVARWIETEENSSLFLPPSCHPNDPRPDFSVYISPRRFPLPWEALRKNWAGILEDSVALLPKCRLGTTRSCNCTSCTWRRRFHISGKPVLDSSGACNGKSDRFEDDAESVTSVVTTDEDTNFALNGRPIRNFELPRVPRSAKVNVGVTPPLSLSVRKNHNIGDLKTTVSNTSLYHLPAISRVSPKHLDVHNADSEDEVEVDNSWRVQIDLDFLLALTDRSPKQRVLWAIWNQFASEKGAAGQFGERYTRYGLELFVATWRNQIMKSGLRAELISFLGALHTHGCIDGPAVVSVVNCLDGLKTIEECAESKAAKGVDCRNFNSESFANPPIPKPVSKQVAKPGRRRRKKEKN